MYIGVVGESVPDNDIHENTMMIEANNRFKNDRQLYSDDPLYLLPKSRYISMMNLTFFYSIMNYFGL